MNRMRQLRETKEISMKEAAEQLGMPYTTYVNYEKGVREPNSETLIQIASFYDTTIDYMLGRSILQLPGRVNREILPSPGITDKVVTFRINADIAAGYDQPAQPLADWEGASIDLPESVLRGRPQSDYFMIRICGNSMYPHYHDGDYVLVLKQSTLNRSGEVGVLLNGDEGTLKKIEYAPGEDWLKLIPFNPEYEPHTISGADLEQCRVIGIPKLLIRNL